MKMATRHPRHGPALPALACGDSPGLGTDSTWSYVNGKQERFQGAIN